MRRPLLLLLSLVLLAVACGDEDHFRVKGTVDGNATLNIRVGYYSNGAFHTILTAARDGFFEFQGSAPEGAVVNLYDHEYRFIGCFYGCNGTDYELSMIRSNPFAMTVKADGRGAEISNRFSGFITSAADSLLKTPNGPIERFVRTNPSDIVSTLLLTNLYDAFRDPVGADSLLAVIEPQARPSSLTGGFQELLQRVLAPYSLPDTLVYRTTKGGRDTVSLKDTPLTIFIADTRDTRKEPSMTHLLRDLRKRHPKDKLRIMEVGLDNDTMEWKRSIALDTATWIQTWTPGSMSGPLADHLGVEKIPHFLVTDSAGAVLYRGASYRQAFDTIDKQLKP